MAHRLSCKVLHMWQLQLLCWLDQKVLPGNKVAVCDLAQLLYGERQEERPFPTDSSLLALAWDSIPIPFKCIKKIQGLLKYFLWNLIYLWNVRHWNILYRYLSEAAPFSCLCQIYLTFISCRKISAAHSYFIWTQGVDDIYFYISPVELPQIFIQP